MPPKRISFIFATMEQEFNDYLKTKKIDPVAFEANEPETFKIYKSEFAQLHPKSFTLQKLFNINIIRRKYTLKNKGEGKAETAAPHQIASGLSGTKPVAGTKPSRPVMKPIVKKEGNSSEKDQARPIRPKIPAKPIVGRSTKPVIKPKIVGQEAKEDPEASKVKMSRPVIKPKIPPKKDE